jgi:hypothetical protein
MYDALDCSVHFLTLTQEGYDDGNVALSFYHDRTHFEPSSRNLYAEYTDEYCAQQGRRFVLHNRLAAAPSKQSRLKDQVKELDELLRPTTTATTTTKTNNSMALTQPPSRVSNRSESSVAVALWLNAQQLLLVMRDATFVWLVVDTISADIVRMQVDKTLPNSQKLSGTRLCECAYVADSQPMFVLAYSDASKLDLVMFNKAAQMSDYLTKWKTSETKLEKLSAFEPTLVAYEFACPNAFPVEKRVATMPQSTSASTTATTEFAQFVLWWPNEPHQAWMLQHSNKSNEAMISLLERDDLRTNVLVLTVSVEHKKRRTAQVTQRAFKSDAQLLAVRYGDDQNGQSLLAVEQSESSLPSSLSKRKYAMTIYKYDLSSSGAEKQTKIKLRTVSMSSLVSSFEHVRFSGKYVLAMCSADQTLIMHDTHMNTSRTHRLYKSNTTTASYDGLEWLVDQLLFVVYDTTERGRCRLIDTGFNELNLKYATRAPLAFQAFSDGLGEHLTAQNRFVAFHSSRRLHTDSLMAFFHYSKGPAGIFRLALPNASNELTLISHYIKCAQLGPRDDNYNNNNNDKSLELEHLRQAVNLLLTLDWQEQAALCMACLSRIMNFMLAIAGRQSSTRLEMQELVQRALSSFYKPIRGLSEQRIYEYRYEVSRYARRYFYVLLKWHCLSKAFALAVDIGAKDLLNDLYYCALEKRQIQLADACRLKYGEMCERDKNTKLNAELRRSIQSVDDNLEATLTELDKFSVSASSTESVDDDDDDDVNNDNDDDDESKQESVVSTESTLLSFTNASNNARLRIAATANDDSKIRRRAFDEAELHDYAMKIRTDNEFLFESDL